MTTNSTETQLPNSSSVDVEKKEGINWLPDLKTHSRPLLSICIPTFNRAIYLEHLLLNLLGEIGLLSDTIEIVVSDNCSTDNTQDVVNGFQAKGLHIKYVKNYRNVGLDLNLRSAVVASSGIHCWLMGDDDAMRKGAVSFMAEHLRIHNPDIAISNRYLCDAELNVVSMDPLMLDTRPTVLFDCNEKSNLLDYFKKCQTTIGMFNFISTIIIRKSCWMQAPEIPGMAKSIFPHVYKIMHILRNQGGRLLYVNEPTVYARNNPRLQEVHGGSEFQDWQLHFYGNIEVADHFFSDDTDAYASFLNPVRRIIEHGKNHYLLLAQKDGYINEAMLTLKKLGIAI